jgi:hypothetical protein
MLWFSKIPLETLPRKDGIGGIKKRNMSEPKASWFRFPANTVLSREPEGQRLAVAFLGLPFLAKQKR